MGIPSYQWLVALLFALALHALAGALFLGLPHAQPLADTSAPGVMISLDSIDTGASQLTASEPEPVSATDAVSPTRTPSETVQPDAASPSPVPEAGSEPSATTTQAPDIPQTVSPQAPPDAGAEASASGVDVPVAQPVMIKARAAVEARVPDLAEADTASHDQPPQRHGSGHAGNPTRTYINLIQTQLGHYKHYPEDSRRDGVEGTVRIYLVVSRNGKVLHASIADSSGSNALDQAAMAMIRQAEPLPAMSDDMQRTRLAIILPVEFALTGPAATD